MTDLVGCIAPEKLEEYRNVFVYLENRNGKISRGALEMLGKGKEISVKLDEKVVGIAIGQDLKAVADEAASFGCDLILGAELSDFNGFSSVAYTNIISDFIFEQKPNIFLISGSREGRDLVSRIAVKCKTGVAADCIELDGDPTNRLLIAWRPSFGDKTIDQILCRKHRPQMITSRPGSYKLPEKVEKPDCETRIKKVKVGKLVAKHKILEFKPKTRLDLTSSKIIVSGGLGIGGPSFRRTQLPLPQQVPADGDELRGQGPAVDVLTIGHRLPVAVEQAVTQFLGCVHPWTGGLSERRAAATGVRRCRLRGQPRLLVQTKAVVGTDAHGDIEPMVHKDPNAVDLAVRAIAVDAEHLESPAAHALRPVPQRVPAWCGHASRQGHQPSPVAGERCHRRRPIASGACRPQRAQARRSHRRSSAD